MYVKNPHAVLLTLLGKERSMNFLTALGWLTLGAIALVVFSAILLVFILGVVAIKVAFEREKDKHEE